jgi:hypothetical protein
VILMFSLATTRGKTLLMLRISITGAIIDRSLQTV